MVSLSKKLTSLVQAADDPDLLIYAFSHVGAGVPNDDRSRGFRGRVEAIRRQLLLKLLSGGMKLQQREQMKERLLALQLFQKGTLNVLMRRFSSANAEELSLPVSNYDPWVRFLAIQSIGWRRLHLESDLIKRLNDPDPVVRDAAHTSLIQVARGTDFGPYPGSSRRGINRSIEKWQQWPALQQNAWPVKPVKDTAIAAEKQAKPTTLEMVPVLLVHDDKPALSSGVAKACDELINAKGAEQISILARLRHGKNSDGSEALALAIPKLSGDIQQQARDALTERLTRLPSATLRDKLQDDNPEVRSAAALACGRKIAKNHIADLVQLLDDPEMAVMQSARVALTELSGEDFGPPSDADRRGRADAVAAWRKWWKERQDKQK